MASSSSGGVPSCRWRALRSRSSTRARCFCRHCSRSLDIGLVRGLEQLLSVAGLLAAAPRLGLVRLDGGGMLKRPKYGRPVRVSTRQLNDALFRLPQLPITVLEQANTALVATQGLFQARLAIF